MNDVKGGSSPACVIAGVGIVVGIHELGDNQSWWHCSADSAACASNGIGC